MRIFQQYWIITLTVFLSSFLSALAISYFMVERTAAVFIVVIFCFFGTILIGVPVSLLIHRLIRSNTAAGFVVKLLLHPLLGGLIMFLWLAIGRLGITGVIQGGGLIFLYCTFINAVIYYVVYALLSKLIIKSIG